MLKFIGAILLLAVSSMLLLQIDDELNPEIAEFLAKSNVAEHSEAYIYLMGINAPADESPLKFGFKKVNQTAIAGENESNQLSLPKEALFTSNKETDYLSAMFSAANIATILAENAVLLERYETFIKMKGYRTLSKPSLSEELPLYHYLMRGNRLEILKAINRYKSSNSQHAIPLLMGNISNLRMQLQNADNLIGKMIYVIMISENIDALSVLTHLQTESYKLTIDPISLTERDFEIVMSREFSLGYSLYKSLDKNPEFFATSSVFPDKSLEQTPQSTPSAWVVRAVFKPIMTVNAEYPDFKETVDASRLTQTQFAQAQLKQEIENDDDTQQSFLSRIRNKAGNVLIDMARPDYNQYIAKLFDLNAKIAILNQTANQPALATDLKQIQNPYYENKASTAYYTKNRNSICLTGPLEDDRTIRCLRVKL